MKGLLLFNVFSIVCLLTQAQVTNSFPDIGIPTVGGSNYMSISNRLFFQAKNQTENGNNRGIVANNLYWDSVQSKWTNGTGAAFDFAMMRFESGGNIGFFNGPVPNPSVRQTFTNSELEAYRTLTLKSNGNVGINIANPGARLEVAGAIRSSGFSSTSGYFEATNVQNGNVYFTTNTISGNGFLKLNRLDGGTVIYLNSFGASYFTGGNVLIGKTSQANTGYKLDVDGPVHATRVVVNSNGADYVFDSSYNLRSLDEVESFIKSNHHLPEIAPAADMQANGIDLGDNQTKLLQKTEELTLYLIEQNKQLKEQLTINTEQNKQLQEQVSEIDALKQLIAKQQEAIEALQQKADKANNNKD